MELHGVVNPLGSDVGECYFEYGTTNEYGQRVECAQTPAEIGKGSTSVPVSAKVEALRGGTTYHFRLVVTKGTTSVPGDDVQARTPTAPVITGGEAPLLGVRATTAQLRAFVNPEGLPVTRCRFEYGTSTAYGHSSASANRSSRRSATAPNPYSYPDAHRSATEHDLPLAAACRRRTRRSLRTGSYVRVSDDGPVNCRMAGRMRWSRPVQKNGASIGTNVFGPQYAVAGDGSSVKATSIQCFAEAVSCTGNLVSEGEPFQFTRTPAGAPPNGGRPRSRRPRASSALSIISRSSVQTKGSALFGVPPAPGESDSWYARQPGPRCRSPISVRSASRALFGVQSLSKDGVAATADLSHVFWRSEDNNSSGRSGNADRSSSTSGAHNSEPMLVGVENAGPPPWQAGATHVNEGAKLIGSCTELGLRGDRRLECRLGGRPHGLCQCMWRGAVRACRRGNAGSAHAQDLSGRRRIRGRLHRRLEGVLHCGRKPV